MTVSQQMEFGKQSHFFTGNICNKIMGGNVTSDWEGKSLRVYHITMFLSPPTIMDHLITEDKNFQDWFQKPGHPNAKKFGK